MPDAARLILLVEDDPDHELLTIRALKKSNIANEVQVARDGEEAINLLFGPDAIQPQVILLDLKLPKVDGLEVLRRIRESDTTRMLPVVVLTSSDEERDVVAQLSARRQQLHPQAGQLQRLRRSHTAARHVLAGAQPMPSNQLEQLEPRHLRVLLVEDNPDDAFLLERHLRRNGFIPQITRVETSSEMTSALDCLNLPDIVLADYNLPNFSGPAALQLLHTSLYDIPFIMLSGAVSEEMAVESMRAGAHDYVTKQNLARLVPALERELKDAAARRQPSRRRAGPSRQ